MKYFQRSILFLLLLCYNALVHSQDNPTYIKFKAIDPWGGNPPGYFTFSTLYGDTTKLAPDGTVLFDLPLSTGKTDQPHFPFALPHTYFPNPAQGKIWLTAPENSNLIILSLTGQKLLATKLREDYHFHVMTPSKILILGVNNRFTKLINQKEYLDIYTSVFSDHTAGKKLKSKKADEYGVTFTDFYEDIDSFRVNVNTIKLTFSTDTLFIREDTLHCNIYTPFTEKYVLIKGLTSSKPGTILEAIDLEGNFSIQISSEFGIIKPTKIKRPVDINYVFNIQLKAITGIFKTDTNFCAKPYDTVFANLIPEFPYTLKGETNLDEITIFDKDSLLLSTAQITDGNYYAQFNRQADSTLVQVSGVHSSGAKVAYEAWVQGAEVFERALMYDPTEKQVGFTAQTTRNATINIPGFPALQADGAGNAQTLLTLPAEQDSLEVYINAPGAIAEYFKVAAAENVLLDTLLQATFGVDTKGPNGVTLDVYAGPELLRSVTAGEDFEITRRANSLTLRARANGDFIEEGYLTDEVVAQPGEDAVVDARNLRFKHIWMGRGEELATYQATIDGEVYSGIIGSNGYFMFTHLSTQAEHDAAFSFAKEHYASIADTLKSVIGQNERDFGQMLAQYSIIEKSGVERTTRLIINGEEYDSQTLFSGDAVFSFEDIRDSLDMQLVIDAINHQLYEKDINLKPGTLEENPGLIVGTNDYTHYFGVLLQSSKPDKIIAANTPFTLSTSAGDTTLLSDEYGTVGGAITTKRMNETANLAAQSVVGHQPNSLELLLNAGFISDTLQFLAHEWYASLRLKATDENGFPIPFAEVIAGERTGLTNENGEAYLDSIPVFTLPDNSPQQVTGTVVVKPTDQSPIFDNTYVPLTLDYGNLNVIETVVNKEIPAFYTHNLIVKLFSKDGYAIADGSGIEVSVDNGAFEQFSTKDAQISRTSNNDDAGVPVSIRNVSIPGHEGVAALDTMMYGNLVLNLVADAIKHSNTGLTVIVQDQDGERIPYARVINEYGTKLTNANGEVVFALPPNVNGNGVLEAYSLSNLVQDTEDNDVDFNAVTKNILIDEATETLYMQVVVDKGGNGGDPDDPPVSNIAVLYAYGNSSGPNGSLVRVWKDGQAVMQGTVQNGQYITNSVEVDKDVLPVVYDSLNFVLENYLNKSFGNPEFDGAEQFEGNLVPVSTDPTEFPHTISGQVTGSKAISSGNYAFFVLDGDTTKMFINGSGQFGKTFYSDEETENGMAIGVIAPGYFPTQVTRNIGRNTSVNLQAIARQFFQDIDVYGKDTDGNALAGINFILGEQQRVADENGYARFEDVPVETNHLNLPESQQKSIRATNYDDIDKTQGYTSEPGSTRVDFEINLETIDELVDHYVQFDIDNNLGKNMQDGGIAELNIPGIGLVNVAIENQSVSYSWQDESTNTNIVATFKNMPGYQDVAARTYEVDDSESFDVTAAGREHYTSLMVNIKDQNGSNIENALVMNSGISDYTDASGNAELLIKRNTGDWNIELLPSNTVTSVQEGNSGKDFDRIEEALLIDENNESQNLQANVAEETGVEKYNISINRAMEITGNRYAANAPGILQIITSQGTYSFASNGSGELGGTFEATPGEIVQILSGGGYDEDYFGVVGLGSTRNGGAINRAAEDVAGNYNLLIVGNPDIVNNPDFLNSVAQSIGYSGFSVQRTLVRTDWATKEYAGDEFINVGREIFNEVPGILTSPLVTLVNFTGGIDEQENMPGSPSGRSLFYRDSNGNYGNGRVSGGALSYGPGPNYGRLLEEALNPWIGDGKNAGIAPILNNRDLLQAVGVTNLYLK